MNPNGRPERAELMPSVADRLLRGLSAICLAPAYPTVAYPATCTPIRSATSRTPFGWSRSTVWALLELRELKRQFTYVGILELSDLEWNAIKGIARYREGRQSPRRQYDPKLIVSGILEKLGTGRSWAETEIQWPSRSALGGAYSYLKETGRWENMLVALRKVRARSGPTAHPHQT